MKILLSLLVVALLAFAVVPMVLADGDDDDGGIDVNVTDPDNVCPVIYQDATQRSWYPNDQTWFTAVEYSENGEDQNCYGDTFIDLDIRGNYVFAGETVTYYVIVEDENGDEDIESVRIDGFGACREISAPLGSAISTCTGGEYSSWENYAAAKFGVDWDDDTMNLYKCELIIPSSVNGSKLITIETTDGDSECGTNGTVTEDKEYLTLNPALQVTLLGAISFGSVEPGATATSNPIQIQNIGTDGVVMDMYIASDDYFTDPGNEYAICGDGNGIPYWAFSYYASKGSVDSGDNNNDFPGVGDATARCTANPDEYTPMPSYADGYMQTMCRIINHQKEGSFLTQGDDMSLRLRLAIPDNCEPGSYNEGEFHVVGKVV
jgi:hypothetical protein